MWLRSWPWPDDGCCVTLLALAGTILGALTLTGVI
jgi:hypothetical protein